jgi:hypothetical protein
MKFLLALTGHRLQRGPILHPLRWRPVRPHGAVRAPSSITPTPHGVAEGRVTDATGASESDFSEERMADNELLRGYCGCHCRILKIGIDSSQRVMLADSLRQARPDGDLPQIHRQR